MNDRIPSSDRDQLARLVFDQIAHPVYRPHEVISESLRTAERLADFLAVHADMATCHGYTLDSHHVDAAASAINQQIKLSAVLAEHLASENKRLSATLQAQEAQA